jgi:hypothetical protein
MKGRLTILSIALVACHLAAANVPAQEKRPQESHSLGLQLFTGNSQQPQYVDAPADGGATLWFNHFKRLPDWKEPAGVMPIMAVRLLRQTKGERVYVRFTIHRGVKFYETEEFVAEYLAGLGEGHTVNELKNFGVEPFRFNVVRREEVAPHELGVGNLTHSVEVLSAEVRDEKKSPLVRLMLKNHSRKRVMSLKVEVLKGSWTLTTGWPLGREGHALIGPGETFELRQPLGGGGFETSGGYVPVMPDGVRVASALFSDGSYEGETEAAAKSAAHYVGYRIQLARLLDLIRPALRASEAKVPTALSDFREKVRALESEADAATIGAAFDAFPGLEERKRAEIESAVEVAMSWLRRDLLVALDQLEKRDAGDGTYFRAWLKGRRDTFEQWLERLSH